MLRLRFFMLCLGLAAPLAGATSALAAEAKRPAEYVMPWEERGTPETDAKARVTEAERLELSVDAMEVIKLPGQGAAVISSHPEVADIYIDDANLLFIFGRIPGTTNVVVGDQDLTPVFLAEVTVVPAAAPE